MKRTCVDCGKAFEITPSEEQFYHSKVTIYLSVAKLVVIIVMAKI